MREVIEQLNSSLEQKRPFAYCRLVETRGSTPQKAGATMLVYANGQQAGTLGGGCVEADVKRRALEILHTGQPQVATFQLDHDYGWDDGLICGGRMKILIQPVLNTEQACEYFRHLCELLPRGGGTEVIVFDQDASALPAPACYLLDADNHLVGTLGGSPDLPAQIRDGLKPLASRPHVYADRGVAFLPTVPRCPLVIVGGGHLGKAIADLATDLDFEVWVVDDRAEFVDLRRFPRAERRVSGDLDVILPELEITADTYCLILTRGHSHDEKALFHLAQRGARFVGMIGSRRKVRMIFEDLLDEGVPQEALEKVYAPLGIEIGSKTVSEIAISIAAELVAHRNCGGRVPGRPDPIRFASQRKSN